MLESITCCFYYTILRNEIPKSQKIISAEIGLYGWAIESAAVGMDLQVHRVAQYWDENVNWTVACGCKDWTEPGGALGELIGTMEVTDVDHEFFPILDIKDTVQDWVDGMGGNYGVMFVKPEGATGNYGIKASEYNDNQRTYLEITYTTCPVDLDNDGDSDGADLAALIENGDQSCIRAFLNQFGSGGY